MTAWYLFGNKSNTIIYFILFIYRLLKSENNNKKVNTINE